MALWQSKVSCESLAAFIWQTNDTLNFQLLEFYGDHNEARQVLNEYAYNSKFPANPNAHVYLYQFLKRQGESKKSLISALKVGIP